jgi:protein-serine/threonine kinase
VEVSHTLPQNNSSTKVRRLHLTIRESSANIFNSEYDARQVDIWATAIVFYCMQFQEIPWRMAKNPSDASYALFVQSYPHSSAPQPLHNLMPKECHSIIKRMLAPDPKLRPSIDDILNDPWIQAIEVCENGKAKNGHTHVGVPYASTRE